MQSYWLLKQMLHILTTGLYSIICIQNTQSTVCHHISWIHSTDGMMMAIFWDAAPCRVVYYWLMFQRSLLPPSLLMTGALSSSETSIKVCQITRRNIPEHSHLHIHCCENWKLSRWNDGKKNLVFPRRSSSTMKNLAKWYFPTKNKHRLQCNWAWSAWYLITWSMSQYDTKLYDTHERCA
jgi:hypothetical protein